MQKMVFVTLCTICGVKLHLTNRETLTCNDIRVPACMFFLLHKGRKTTSYRPVFRFVVNRTHGKCCRNLGEVTN